MSEETAAPATDTAADGESTAQVTGADLLSQESTATSSQETADGGQADDFTTRFPWAEGIENEDYRQLIENKGWKDLNGVLKTTLNAQKMLGVPEEELVRLPKPGDAEGLGQVFEKLGKPDGPDKYDFQGVEEGDMTKWFREQAHEANLTQDQAATLLKQFDEYAAGITQQTQEQKAQQSEQEMNDLKREWGKEYDNNLQAAKVAARKLEVSEDDMVAIEDAVGTKKFLEFFARIGRSYGEGSFHDGDGGSAPTPFGMTPQAAERRLNALTQDPAFQQRIMSPDAKVREAAIQERRDLMRFINP